MMSLRNNEPHALAGNTLAAGTCWITHHLANGFRISLKWSNGALAGWRERRQQHINRQAFLHTTRLDDQILDDIGITRGDVEWAANLPLHINASAELERIKRDNRQAAVHRARPVRRR